MNFAVRFLACWFYLLVSAYALNLVDAKATEVVVSEVKSAVNGPEPSQKQAIPEASESDVTKWPVVVYAIRINDQDFGDTILIQAPDGRLLAGRSNLDTWRLKPPAVAPILIMGESYYPLNAYEDILIHLDEKLQKLALQLPPRYFPMTMIGHASAINIPPPPAYLGGFGNYDLFYSSTSGASTSNTLNGAFEVGMFNQLGAGVTGFLTKNGNGNSDIIRLDSTWTRDFPAEIKTLTLGDTIGNSGAWGRPVRFGGIRYGTNFATQPGFIKQPLPGISGESALPSTTELYINGILRQSQNIPPGPFQISNLPVINGEGTVKIVVRDLLGREQVISQPYYVSTQLLRKGLTEESSEIGFIRNDFGIESNNYGRFAATVQRRKGFSDSFTGEARVEVLSSQQTGGLSGNFAFPGLGIFNVAAAASHNNAGYGGLLMTSFEHQTSSGINFSVSSQSTTPHFTQLGLQSGQQPPARITSANVGFSTGHYGSLGFSYVMQDNRSTLNNELISANYSLSVGKSSALIISGYKSLIGESTQALSVTLSVGFGERSSAYINQVSQKNANQTAAQFQQNLPAGTGMGYRLLATSGDSGERQEAGLSLQNSIGTYSVETGHADGINSYRANASGGLAVLGSRVYLSRRLTNSFGVVQMPEFPNLGIYVNNQLVDRTDEHGNAMLPNLQAYQDNPVAINPDELPLDAEVNAIKVSAIPYFRSGVLVSLPIKRIKSALLTILQADGIPMPLGSEVSLAGRDEIFMVAERGEVYVTGLAAKNRLRARWEEQTCEFEMDVDLNSGPLAKLGPYTCIGVKP